MPSTMPGRELVQNFLKDNDIKITDLAKMYKLSNQDARDYVSGRKTNPAANRFILTVISDFNLRQKGALTMQELIKVQVHNDRQLVSARDLHEGLGLKKKFTDWWKQNSKDFEENVDYTTSPKSHVVQSGNGTVRRYDDYALTIDMAKQLCLMSRTEKGKQYRKYLIEVERKWNNPQEIVKRGYAILQNENTRLKLENKQMKPKALFADAVATSKNDILIGQLAKILRQNGYETGQNRLLKWLREHHYLCSKGLKYNQPTQKAMELGLFRVKERTVNNPDGSSRITVTTKVTGKGQQYFINRLLSSEPTQLSLEIEGV